MGSRRPGWSVLVLLLLVAGAARADEGTTAEEGERLLASGRAADAALAMQRLLDEVPAEERTRRAAELAGVESVLARALAATGAAEESLAHFESALHAREDARDRVGYAEALLAIARVNLDRPNPSNLSVAPYLTDAIAAAEKVDDPAFRSRRERVVAECLGWRGDDAGAVEHWKAAALETLPAAEAKDPLSRMALSLYRLGRFAEAADAWHRAGNRLGEASAWAALRDGEKAIDLYAALLREHPEDEGLVAQALAAARYANARPRLAEALAAIEAKGAVEARLLRTRAILAEESNDAAGAEDLFRKATGADPTWALPWVDLGRVLLLAGGAVPSDAAKEAALDAWLEALRRAPEDERVKRLVWDQAGIDYNDGTRSGGNPVALRRSLKAQRALADAFPDDAEARANLGNSLRMAGEAEASVAAYRLALQVNPDSASIQSDEGLALAGAGKTAEALVAFERAVALEPEFTSARQNAARFRWVAGDDDAAEAHLAAALSAARNEGKGEMLFRFLLDRTWRTRRRPELR